MSVEQSITSNFNRHAVFSLCSLLNYEDMIYLFWKMIAFFVWKDDGLFGKMIACPRRCLRYSQRAPLQQGYLSYKSGWSVRKSLGISAP